MSNPVAIYALTCCALALFAMVATLRSIVEHRDIRFRHVGGIRFLRLGKLQFTFCVCRKA